RLSVCRRGAAALGNRLPGSRAQRRAEHRRRITRHRRPGEELNGIAEAETASKRQRPSNARRLRSLDPDSGRHAMQANQLTISNTRADLDLEMIYAFLSEQTAL